jgi:hypothetical protein
MHNGSQSIHDGYDIYEDGNLIESGVHMSEGIQRYQRHVERLLHQGWEEIIEGGNGGPGGKRRRFRHPKA